MTEPKNPPNRELSTAEAQPTTDVRSLDDAPKSSEGPSPTPAAALLQFAGTWVGDDLDECLDLVYRTRGQARF